METSSTSFNGDDTTDAFWLSGDWQIAKNANTIWKGAKVSVYSLSSFPYGSMY